MQALRFLTILITTFSLYTAQTFVYSPDFDLGSSVAYAGEDTFFSGGAGGEVGLLGEEVKADDKAGLNMNMIILFAAVLATPLYVMYCFDVIDAWIFSATALAYIAAEIANFKQYKAQSDRNMVVEITDDATKNIEQQESLRKAAAQTKASAEAADRRGKAAMFAAMGFYAAGAVALTMATLDSAPFVESTCLSIGKPGPKGGVCTMYACASGLVGQNESIQKYYLNGDQKFELIAGTNYKNLTEYAKSAETDLDYLIRNIELKRYAKGAKQAMRPHVAQQIEFMYPAAKKESKYVSAFKFIGYNIADLLFPRVHAGNGNGQIAAVGIGAVGAVALATVGLKMSPAIKKFAQNGFLRGAGHMAFGAIATVVAGDSKKAAKKLRERASQYEQLATRLGVQTIGIANHARVDETYEVGSAQAINVQSGTTTNVTTCFTGSKGELNEDSKCACRGNNSCKKSEIPKILMAGMSVPKSVTASTSSIGTHGNSIFKGDFTGGLTNANAAGKNALRLKKLNVGLQKKANAAFVGAGGKPIDFEKLGDSTRSRLIKAAISDLKNLSAAGKEALGKQFPGVFGEGTDAQKEPSIRMGNTGAKTGGITASNRGSKSNKKNNAIDGFSFELDDTANINLEETAFAKLEKTDSSDQIEMNADDIDSDRNKDIFNLITKRYFKTAYPRFFEKDLSGE